MMNNQNLLKDYQRYRETCSQLLNGWQPAEAQPVNIKHSRQTLTETELQQALMALGELEGWLLLTDQRIILKKQGIEAFTSWVVAAELYKNGQSIRVRQLEDANWLMLITEIEPVKADQSATHLAIGVNHLAAEESLGQLEYQQLWCRDEQGRLSIEDAVFTGFTGV